MTADAAMTAEAVPGVRVKEAARHLGVAPRTIRRWCAIEAIPATRRGKLWFLSPEYVAAATTWPPVEGEVA